MKWSCHAIFFFVDDPIGKPTAAPQGNTSADEDDHRGDQGDMDKPNLGKVEAGVERAVASGYVEGRVSCC